MLDISGGQGQSKDFAGVWSPAVLFSSRARLLPTAPAAGNKQKGPGRCSPEHFPVDRPLDTTRFYRFVKAHVQDGAHSVFAHDTH